MQIHKGKSTFLIPAPLEKIKGIAEDTKGTIFLDIEDLNRSRGEVFFKLSTLKTQTFSDPGKNETQSQHARN